MQTKYAVGIGARAFPSMATAHAPAGADPHASLRRRITRLLAYGHRGSGTENEAGVAEYLLRKLAETGLDAHKEAFAGSRSMGTRLLVHVLAAMAGLALLPWLPIVAAILVAIALTSLVAEQMTWGVWLSRCVCRATSYNVVGRSPASGAAARRLVLCAHYDTNKTAWLWAFMRCLTPIWARCPTVLKPPLLVLGLLMLAHGAFAVFVSFLPSPQILWPATWLIGSAYAVVAILLGQWALGKSVPGAADNASGVAAVMKLAKRWCDARPAHDVELVVLFSGCEESGLMGAAAWADRHRDELAAIPTNVINLDGLGFGPPRFLGAEVPAVGLPLRAPARLIDACSRLATEMGLHDAGPHALPGPTDGLAFLARRIRAITIVGFADGQQLPNYHTLSDTTQNVDFPAAERGIEFAKALLWALATEKPQ